MVKKQKHPNRLISEKSPYLLQHAHNPVDWFPWSDEAFEIAQKENKPVFLSIGYSTCHWCHVMEKESFENEGVAKLMNEAFVNIKVDREERPDIDSLYMSVAQMMTGSGGWPLTILMTPDKKPFFAATYIPRESRFGRMGMLEFIPHIQNLWKTQPDRVKRITDQVLENLTEFSQGVVGATLDEGVLEMSFDHLSTRFDDHLGGFSYRPKFPTPHNLLFLLRYWHRTRNDQALEMAEKTLQAMRRGGIFDHVGLGFHRYSTDPEWLLPHFEKMLYDQAMLTMAYIEAFQATKKEEYAQTAREIIAYVLRDMSDSEGGFYSAEDADSEGVEGKFYVWTLQEIHDALPKKEAAFVIKAFNILEEGNFTEEVTGRRTGQNILHLKEPKLELAKQLKVPKEKLWRDWERIRQKLFQLREDRIHPHKDDKILTDWNGLMIAALAKAGRVLQEKDYIQAAENALAFILDKMRTEEGRLLHRYRDGEAAVPAFLDDYAFLIWGLIELYQTTLEPKHLNLALNLNEELLQHFWDEKEGGFYFTADDAEKLLVRKKEIYDGAIPSGNSVTMWNLIRLSAITGEPEFETRAAKLGQHFSTQVLQSPSAHNQLMIAVNHAVGPSHEIVIVGNSKEKDTLVMVKAIQEQYLPNTELLLIPIEEKKPEILEWAPFAAAYKSIDGKATAYVCANHTCQSPTTDIQEMLNFLSKTKT